MYFEINDKYDGELRLLFSELECKFIKDIYGKKRFLFVTVLAFLVSGCMDTIAAVPAAAVNGVGNVVGGIWSAVTSIF